MPAQLDPGHAQLRLEQRQRLQMHYFRYAQGLTTLWQVGLHTGESTPIDIQPISWATQIDNPFNGEGLAFLGTAASQPKQIWNIHENKINIIVSNEIPKQLEGSYSKPQAITFIRTDNTRSMGSIFPRQPTRCRRCAAFDPGYPWRADVTGFHWIQHRGRLLHLTRICLRADQLPRQQWIRLPLSGSLEAQLGHC